MNFLSVLYAKAGITVDGVTTLNNTATALTPATNDNSTKIATTAFVKNQNYYPYPTGTTAQYVRGDGSLATFPTVAAEAKTLITEVYNETGATLTKGTVVYINGGHGNLPTVTKALANSDATSAQTYGVVQSDITDNNNGFVVVIGSLTDLDTFAYANGTILYLSPTTAGAWTSTKPYAPQHIVYVGIVVRSHPTQGVVEIKIQNGYEMDELHNVSAQNPANGDILQFNYSTQLWTKTAGTTTNITEGTNLYYTDARSRAAFSEIVTGLEYNSTTGVLSLTTGYSIPTTASQSTWDTAYNDSIVSAAVTGTTTKTLTLTQQDGGTITASWTDDNTDAVSSVFGRTGAVVAASGDYTTTQVTEGTNLYFTDARARAAITLTTSGTSGAATYSGGVLNIPQYQAALTNPVTGTGTTNYLPKFTGTSALGNSQIFDNGTNVGIGTASPSHKLTVTGDGSGTMKVGGPGVSGNYTGISLNGSLDISNYNILSSPTDNHLYINRPTGNSIYFRANNNDQVTINSSGKVGIGTTNPLSLLHIYGSNPRNLIQDSSTGYPYVQLNNSSGNFYLSIDNSAGSGFGSAYARYIYSEGAYPLILVTNSAERMRITSGGNVLIGTTTDAGYKLDVFGTARFTGQVVSNTQFYAIGTPPVNSGALMQIRDTNADGSNISFGGVFFNSSPGTDFSIGKLSEYNNGFLQIRNGNNGAELLRIASTGAATFSSSVKTGGQVTIEANAGTIAGGRNSLYLKNTNVSGNQSNIIVLGSAGTASSWEILNDINADGTTINRLDFLNAGNVRFSLTADGGSYFSGAAIFNSSVTATNFLGYSTTNDYQLRLGYNSTFFYDIGRSSVDGLLYFYGSQSNFTGYVFSGADGERMRITSAGNVGIGTTSPAAKLDVDSTGYSIFANNSGGNRIVKIGTQSVSGEPAIQATLSNGTARYLMLNPDGGNILIGTTGDAGYKLDVNGTARVSGDAYFGTFNGNDKYHFEPFTNLAGGANNAYLVSGKADNNERSGFVLQARNSIGEEYNAVVIEGYNSTATNTPLTIDSTGAATFSSSVTATSFIKSGGTSSQYLMADGSTSTLTNPITGTGTTNYLPKFTGTSALGNSLIYDNGTNVGINTASPLTQLTLNGDLSLFTAKQIRLYNSAKNNWAELSSPLINGDSEIDLKIVTRTGIFYFNPTGSLGIGTTSPSTKLGVAGDITLQLSGASIRDINSNALLSVQNSNELWLGGGGVGFSTIFYAGAAERMRITSAGNVGIGTTSPTEKLHVYQNADDNVIAKFQQAFDSRGDLLQFTNAHGTGYIGHAGDNSGDFSILNASNTNTYFTTNNTTRLFITAGGNVLIGTTTDAGYKFYVNGGGLFNGVVTSYATMDHYARRINSPEGASYVTGTSSVTGAIKIKLPVARNNSATMMMFRVKIYQYSTGNCHEFQIAGYNYNLGGWYNPSVTDLTDNGSNFSVRFGTDATSDCVWIGETNSGWSYPQVFVTDFQAGYSGQGIEWATGWNISFETSFDTVEETRLASQVITSRSIGAQSVNYAVSAGTAGALTSMNISQFTNDAGYITSTSSTFSYTASVTLSPTWQNTGVSSANLTGSGVYIVTCNANDFGVSGGQYDCTYTGIMYWFAGATNNSNTNEIILHHTGHADNGRYIYLRTISTVSADGKTYLQISGNGTNSGASNYQLTFKKIL